MTFIHQEVYVDNQPSKGCRPQFNAFHLRTEPWLFAINRRGIIVARFEGAFGTAELSRRAEGGTAVTARRTRRRGCAALAAGRGARGGCGSSRDPARRERPQGRTRAGVFAGRVRTDRADHGRTADDDDLHASGCRDGRPLTTYKTGPVPHTGVHLIVVRDDLAYIIHDHPPIPPAVSCARRSRSRRPGPTTSSSTSIRTSRAASRTSSCFATSTSPAPTTRSRCPAFHSADQIVAGYHFDMQAVRSLHAIQAAFLHIDVTDPHGRPVHFIPGSGHWPTPSSSRREPLTTSTPMCARLTLPTAEASSGPTRITGSAPAPGKLTLGVLLPVPGTWRLFVQMRDPRARGHRAIHPPRHVTPHPALHEPIGASPAVGSHRPS